MNDQPGRHDCKAIPLSSAEQPAAVAAIAASAVFSLFILIALTDIVDKLR